MLTSKQNKVLEVIQGFYQENGYLPTLEEIGNFLGIGRSTVHKHVHNLIGMGYLQQADGKAAYDIDDNGISSDMEIEEAFSLPFLGKIAAGLPIDAMPDAQPVNLAKVFYGSNRYVLKVSGDSMIEAGIWDEDFIVIQKEDTAREGDIIVALVNDYEVTLKYYHPKETGVVELRPANSSMDPMYYPAEAVRIQGKLVGVFRDYQ